MPENTAQKAALRRELLANRQAIAPEVRNAMDAAIARHVIAWRNAHPFGILGVYWPIRGEPDLRACYALLAEQGVPLALPIVVARDAPLRFLSWEPGDAMIKDSFGVAIPASGEEVQPDALLIPCVGFNEQRYRLGYGGGFYDRTLASLRPKPFTVGLAYDFAYVPDMQPESHDVPLDAILADTGVMWPGR